MDELELLKKDWKKATTEYKNYSDADIYPMLHKKSSSIVRTLYYISLAELGFWILISTLPYLFKSKFNEQMAESYKDPWFTTLSVLSFVIIFVFVYLLYASHKAISVTDNAKKLMEKILRTRKVIKYYVIYNLVMIFISIPFSLYLEYNQNMVFHDQIDAFNTKQMFVLYASVTLLTGVCLLLFWLFYKLLYGILLKRLNRNYNELKKLEV
ncbi:hypothetical protein DFQ11_102604 [Winogradskyella epiphytica]|uniref:Uncharacterized protein n=1 Tax=Winogradskyella epiphytica TaxID=262005 RepID=A0A2V4XGP7_9FLAO|nr:hypothetical protein [Winogradskyella epiphytica]PYE82024.1 hypothetical protein DFQ11_102604 [Winogradskyella epiphytica]GGW61016.1 hypothetical protein GCM10008085_10700 [Winogradskyella epiphytica]